MQFVLVFFFLLVLATPIPPGYIVPYYESQLQCTGLAIDIGYAGADGSGDPGNVNGSTRELLVLHYHTLSLQP